MAREGISFDQVAAAADALVGAGKTPTIKAVRDSIGTGSPNTVHRHLTAWRAARPQPVAFSTVEVPAKLAAAYLEDLEQKTAAARADVEAQLVQSQAEAAELSATGEALEVERDSLAEQIVMLTTERDQAQATATERAAEIARQSAEIDRERKLAGDAQIETATTRLKIEAQAGKLAEQAQEIERLRSALAVADLARHEAAQIAAVTAAKLEAAERRTADAEMREQLAQNNAREALAEAKAAAAEASELRYNVREAETLAKSAVDAAVAAQANEKAAEQQTAELRGKLAAISLPITESAR